MHSLVADVLPETGTQGVFSRKEEDILDRPIAQYESLIHRYYPETKALEWFFLRWQHSESPPPKKARVQLSVGKVLLTIFWNQRGVFMKDFLAKGTTVTGTYFPPPTVAEIAEFIKTERRSMLT